MSDKVIRAVCFDMFYTLADPHVQLHRLESDALGLSPEVWNKAMWDEDQAEKRGLGIINTPEEIIEQACSLLPMTFTAEQKAAAMTAKLERMRISITDIDPMILDTLRCLKQRGYKLGLISNADVTDRLHWQESPLYPLFDDAIFSCDVHMVKPDPRIYLLSLEHLGVAPSEAAFVGDGGSDELRGARSLGMTTVCTEYLTRAKGHTRAVIHGSADHVITSFRSLKRIFR